MVGATWLTLILLAEQKRSADEIAADLGVRRSVSALFATLGYGITVPPADLPGRAVREFDRPNDAEVTVEKCRIALAECLAKGWLQIIDEGARARIADELRRAKVLGPIYGGLPEVGCVDFTEAGAELRRRLRDQRGPERQPFVYTDVVHEKTTWFFRSFTAATAAIEKFRGWDDVVAIEGPNRIGPWRAQWWRWFPEGYRVETEQRRQWWGQSSGGGDECYLACSSGKSDTGKLRHVLDCHNVTFAEWLVLAYMEEGSSQCRARELCRQAATSGRRRFGEPISEEQSREALAACLRYGWLSVVDQRFADEIQSILDRDPAILAVPRIAEHRPRACYYEIDPLGPDHWTPKPLPPWHRFDTIDFCPSGAALYRTIAAEWLGPDWEDDLDVSHGSYWEEHHYCETEEGFQRIVDEHAAQGNCLRASRLIPIGPWCFHWWERFPAGFRLELDFGELTAP